MEDFRILYTDPDPYNNSTGSASLLPVVVLMVTSLSWERNCSTLLGQCNLSYNQDEAAAVVPAVGCDGQR